MSFLAKLIVIKTKKIRVQPTSVSRRKKRDVSKGRGRIQSGRRTTLEDRRKIRIKRNKGKRKHNLGQSVKDNTPNAKFH